MTDPAVTSESWAWIVDNFEALLAIPGAIAISAVTSWITVRLSVGRFREERWWERRAQAYERVIEALHDAKASASDYLDDALDEREFSDEERREINVRSIQAKKEIERASNLGGFLLCQAAWDRLMEYQVNKEEGSGGYQMGYVEMSYHEADDCLKDIIKIARDDLQIKGHEPLKQKRSWPFRG